MQKRTPAQLIGFIVVAVALVAVAAVSLGMANASDAAVVSQAPAGESRYPAVEAVLLQQATRAPSQAQRISALETRTSRLERAVFGATPVPPSATPGATPSATPTSKPATATPGVTPSVTPSPAPATSTPQPPTTTPMPPHLGGFDCAIPAAQRNYICGDELERAPANAPNLAGQACPNWVHDRYIVTAVQEVTGEWVTKPAPATIAPHEAVWRTWHPSTDPATGCVFQHEHGEAPLPQFMRYGAGPAFGLQGCLHWLHMGRPAENHCSEPHTGFKLQTAVPGEGNDEGGSSLIYAQHLIHFGTDNILRARRQHHTVEYWLIIPGVQDYTHVMGMADFGAFPEGVGDLRRRDQVLAGGARANFRAFERVGEDAFANNPYEAWNAEFEIRHPNADLAEGRVIWRFGLGMNAFDPGTAFIGTTDGRFIPDENGNPQGVGSPGAFGCRREVYFGSGFGYWWPYMGNPSVYTDMMGNPMRAGEFGGALQVISVPTKAGPGGIGRGQLRVNAQDSNAEVFKDLEDFCTDNITVPN